MTGAVAVLDIGKTNVKLEVFARDGALLWERSTPNRQLAGPPYPHADVEAIWAFLLGALAEANAAAPISAIVTTTHGCAGALIDEAGLVLPVMDYEFGGVEEVEASYAPLRPPFSHSFSPRLPAGQNLGRQVAWQKQRYPEAFARARHFVPYPQYWTWRLCGIAASEATSYGSHSDLWAPVEGQFSSLAAALDVEKLMPPMQPAWRRLGAIKPEVAAAARLAPDVGVICGVHDSNASLLPHLASRAPPFTIVSTGTWVILMAVGLGLGGLNPADDTLANVDVEGRPVATGRFMGGREYGQIAGATTVPDAIAIARVVASGALALPCFAGQGGPFAGRTGTIHGEVAKADLPALATLYAALMSDLMLTRLGAAAGDLIVEGSLAANAPFCQVLAALRPRQAVFAATDAAGAARGAALLAQWPPSGLAPPAVKPMAPFALEGLSAYCTAWAAAVVRA